ncbi:MAG: pilus assembly protein [Proteobacteria bacterium]|nr:pilus assembly protein [Pseudomonadota bacterium]
MINFPELRSPTLGLGNRQQGVALAISLILLVVLSLVGLSTVRTVTQQEGMSSQSHDRSLAYQFAEAALREGEQQARIQSQTANAAIPTDQYIADGICNAAAVNRCANGLCSTPDPDCDPRWQNSAFNSWTTYTGLPAIVSQTGNILIGAVGASQPQYFIEILRPVGTAVCTTPVGPNFDRDCNQKFPDPDSSLPCSAGYPAPPGQQYCNFYRYRITARVQMAGRATVMLQSVFSVQPN